MVDWTQSMQQTYEYYMVDPNTWKDTKPLRFVKSCSITRDDSTDTLGSATIELDEMIGECYIRVYLVTIQNDIKERHPLGTFLVQTMPSKFDGRIETISADAYTPLLELKENPVTLGYSILKGENIMDRAGQIVREHVRAPVVETANYKTLEYDFVSDGEENWLSYTADLISVAKYKLALDELGRILFAPEQELISLQPITDYTDDNCSILYPEISISKDLYGIPNVVEVVYSNGTNLIEVRVVNDDENSMTSTVSRGREIIYRDTNPSLPTNEDGSSNHSRAQIEEYARNLLRSLSSMECTITYTHGYNGVRIGDCVRFNHRGAKLHNVKAKVISQTIKCEPGCPVSETAVFTKELWR